ncbi:hypothetical protein GCM10009664_56060 [Kitasatospora gansuensis]
MPGTASAAGRPDDEQPARARHMSPASPIPALLIRISSYVLFRPSAVGRRMSPRSGRHRGARAYRGGLIPVMPGEALWIVQRKRLSV